MREQWYHEFMGEMTLPEVALELHGHVTGSNDRNDEWAVRAFLAIRHALMTWKASTHTGEFDDGVRGMLTAAANEFTAHVREQKKWTASAAS